MSVTDFYINEDELSLAEAITSLLHLLDPKINRAETIGIVLEMFDPEAQLGELEEIADRIKATRRSRTFELKVH